MKKMNNLRSFSTKAQKVINKYYSITKSKFIDTCLQDYPLKVKRYGDLFTKSLIKKLAGEVYDSVKDNNGEVLYSFLKMKYDELVRSYIEEHTKSNSK